MRRLAVLQWVGLLAGAALWGTAHVVGYGVTEADCSPGSSGWGIGLDLWEGVLLSSCGVLVLASAVSAAAVIVRTAGTSYEAPPPAGRIRFFAIAALVADVIFLVMIALYTAGAIASIPCRGA